MDRVEKQKHLEHMRKVKKSLLEEVGQHCKDMCDDAEKDGGYYTQKDLEYLEYVMALAEKVGRVHDMLHEHKDHDDHHARMDNPRPHTR